MQQVVDLALAKNPSLLAAQQNLLSVRALETQAGVRANPFFTLTGAEVTEPAYVNNPFTYAAQFSRLFERGEKRRWRLDSARSSSAQTEAQLHVTEQQTILAVRQAFTAFLVAKTARKLAEDNLADYRRELQIASDRYQAGDLAKLDFERLDLQLAQFETDRSNAITNAQQASDQLQLLLGYDHPHTDFDIVGDIVPPAVALSMDDLEQRGLANRGDLKAAQSAIAVAEAQARLAYANSKADPTAELEFDRTGHENSFGFYVNVPLRIFDRNQGNIASTKFTAQSNRFAAIAAHNQVISDIDQAYSGYLNSKLLSDRYNGHYLDEAHDVLDIARFSFEHGGLALIDYLDALRDARSVTASALSAYQQTWLAIHQLSFVTATTLAP
ncbi:MAG: TolC family protein [Acidobacteriota bacterium]|nr:TolC family protein [Acidobacteriota bacterium]